MSVFFVCVLFDVLNNFDERIDSFSGEESGAGIKGTQSRIP